MDFAVELGSGDRSAARGLLAAIREWRRPTGRGYLTGEVTTLEHPLLSGCQRAFFLKIPPGGKVHRHSDAIVCETHHIVVETNDLCLNFWEDEEGEHSTHLELGKRYRIVDRSTIHWAVNDGLVDRVHLLIEYPISTCRRG